MTENNLSYEVMFVDDGSKDGSWKVVESLKEQNPEVKGIKFQRNYGKSAALQKGFEAVQGQVVITMDADLQDSPDEIPELYRMIMEDDFDVVSGWKKKRYDPITKTIPTKLYNWAARRLTGIYLHDFNCGLKAYKNEVVKSIELYGDMHRYIPPLAKFAGFSKIGEKVVQRIGKLFINQSGKLISQRTEFYIALAAMIMGVQFFLAGFLAELSGRNSSTRNHYLVEKIID